MGLVNTPAVFTAPGNSACPVVNRVAENLISKVTASSPQT